ncbi:MAG: D-alanyl-D-alanine carboxypeptidase/D-alanyl-D-alanine-endopeptidase [Frankiaceae bacterium]|nr:D-alanyl-D-alanine carboxypeptidase/D-alanyl-D-alanine-endopeptidase [Frankiaceae bacterium]
MTVRRRTPLALAALAVATLGLPAHAVLPGDPLTGDLLTGNPAPPIAASVVIEPVALQGEDPAAVEDLAARVNAALATGTAHTIGAAVDVDGLGVVVRRDAAHALPPASTQKSFTAVAALLALPTGFRYTTEVAARAKPAAGILPGSIWLVAGGDPYLTRSGLRALAHSVRAAGVTYVAADLLLDDSRYDARRHADGWKSSFVPDESGPLSAMSVDQNQWRHDSFFLSDPAQPAAQLFRDYLKAEGVTVHGVIKRMRRPADAQPIASRQSGPLQAVLRRTLKDSNNFAAELVLKEIGKVVSGNPSSAGGHAAVREVLADRGVAAGTGSDGSGLSAYDRQTATAQLALLQAVDASPSAADFRSALPVACGDGTLEKRMCNTAAAGRLFAKTGTLPGVRALAGYTTTVSGRSVWFSFQLTGISDGLKARNALDAAAVVLASATE